MFETLFAFVAIIDISLIIFLIYLSKKIDKKIQKLERLQSALGRR